MNKKYCNLYGKVVHGEKCLECGNLTQSVGQPRGIQERVWDCKHLFIKKVFTPRRNTHDGVELPLGFMQKYTYNESDMPLSLSH